MASLAREDGQNPRETSTARLFDLSLRLRALVTTPATADGSTATVKAESSVHAMICGGAALEGKRTVWWNFVSSSRERLEQAKRDWRDGKFDEVPGETDFIPLPE